ncbi:hypothetical protein VOLCADRAFT_101442 [Volvox carteri f. nagariensis]|uniref:Uncharacterized protein n=1 Tax=Volvox carteri f. nagariensis TaxID=3068 RepID=D8UMN7_VOLCA|nr:uncharacterized protein VOLCADRAFT_101442 [Volvox carteri f. nagariensis]EFJ39012.1 hypothetical protein VOLCADRAFT_101442 [Volvox carteri f. nagariensis]|eukprot:XP_002959923.1 hypothetical protein VOLCADRAFT_101442 [Volvox carteri f. nagariensis]
MTQGTRNCGLHFWSGYGLSGLTMIPVLGPYARKCKAIQDSVLRNLWPLEIWRTSDALKEPYKFDVPPSFSERLAGVRLNDCIDIKAVYRRSKDNSYPNDVHTWFMCRKCAAVPEIGWWVGKVAKAWRLPSYRTDQIDDVVLEVSEWYEPSLPLLDDYMNVPVLRMSKSNPFYLAKDVAPVRVTLQQHPTKPRAYCLLCRSYNAMSVAGWGEHAPMPLTKAVIDHVKSLQGRVQR